MTSVLLVWVLCFLYAPCGQELNPGDTWLRVPGQEWGGYWWRPDVLRTFSPELNVKLWADPVPWRAGFTEFLVVHVLRDGLVAEPTADDDKARRAHRDALLLEADSSQGRLPTSVSGFRVWIQVTSVKVTDIRASPGLGLVVDKLKHSLTRSSGAVVSIPVSHAAVSGVFTVRLKVHVKFRASAARTSKQAKVFPRNKPTVALMSGLGLDPVDDSWFDCIDRYCKELGTMSTVLKLNTQVRIAVGKPKKREIAVPGDTAEGLPATTTGKLSGAPAKAAERKSSVRSQPNPLAQDPYTMRDIVESNDQLADESQLLLWVLVCGGLLAAGIIVGRYSAR